MDLHGGVAQSQERFKDCRILQSRLGKRLREGVGRRHHDPGQIPATVHHPKRTRIQPARHQSHFDHDLAGRALRHRLPVGRLRSRGQGRALRGRNPRAVPGSGWRAAGQRMGFPRGPVCEEQYFADRGRARHRSHLDRVSRSGPRALAAKGRKLPVEEAGCIDLLVHADQLDQHAGDFSVPADGCDHRSLQGRVDGEAQNLRRL